MTSPQQSQQKSTNIHKLLHKLPRTTLRLWNFLFIKSRKAKQIKYTHAQMADWCGMSISSVIRSINVLIDEGIIWKQSFRTKVRYNEPNRYFINDDYKQNDVDDILEVFFNNFFKFSLFKLLFNIPPKPAVGEDDIPLILKCNYKIDIDLIKQATMIDSFKSFFKKNRHHPPLEIIVPFASHQASQETHFGGTPLNSFEQNNKNGIENSNEQLPF